MSGPINWEAIGKAFCANTMSNVKLAKAHCITEGAVRKKAKERGWVRDQPYVPPAAKLPPVPKALLRRDPVAPKPQVAELPPIPTSVLRHEPTTPATATNTELTGDLIRRMLDELDCVTSHIGELEELIEAETAGDQDGRRRAGMMKAISLPVRSNTLRLLLAAQVEANKKPEKGKKATQQDKAREVSSGGKFKSSAPPLRVVGAT